MTLKEARLKLMSDQRILAVAIKNLLPKDINEINRILDLITTVSGNKESNYIINEKDRQIIKNLKTVNRKSEIIYRSQAARIKFSSYFVLPYLNYINLECH
jgi:hypothetical protein